MQAFITLGILFLAVKKQNKKEKKTAVVSCALRFILKDEIFVSLAEKLKCCVTCYFKDF